MSLPPTGENQHMRPLRFRALLPASAAAVRTARLYHRSRARLSVLTAVLIVCWIPPTRAVAQLTNLARLPGVRCVLLDESGQVLEKRTAKQAGRLVDGKKRTGSVASRKGANRDKKLSVRFDFLAPVSPGRIVVTRRYPDRESEWIDRIRVLAGSNPDAMTVVTAHTDFERAFESTKGMDLEVPLPETTGRYLQVELEQDAHPDHARMVIMEIEVYGSADDKTRILAAGGIKGQSRRGQRPPRTAGSIQVPRPVPGNVFELGSQVQFVVNYQADGNGPGSAGIRVVDYFGQTVQEKALDFTARQGETQRLQVDLGGLDAGFYKMHVAIRQNRTRSERVVRFGVARFLDRTAEEARRAGSRFGMKMWGPRPFFNSYEAMGVCARLGLQWTRQLFTRDVQTLDKLPVNIILKVEKFPAEAYDAERYGAIDEYKRRKHGWGKTTLPLENPYKNWLRKELAALPEGHNVYEIWNEPWGKMPPADFARLAQYAKDVIREHDSDAVVGPNLGHLDYDAEFIKEGGMEGMDAMFIHVYAHPERSGKRQKIRHIRNFYRDRLGRDLDFYVTEHGSPSPPAGPRKNSEERAALRAVRDSFVFYAEDIKGFMPHVLGQSERKPTQKEHWYGYFRRNLEPKPGLFALATCARMIDCSRYAGDLYYKPEVGVMLFDKDGSYRLALWTNDMEVPVQVDTGVDAVTLVDIVGKEEQRRTDNGVLSLTLTGTPIYLVGVSPDLEKQASKELREDRWVEGTFVRHSRTIHRMKRPPVIDGTAGPREWGGQTTIEMRNPKLDDAEASATGRVAWDAGHLYIAAAVTDDQPYYNTFKPAEVYAGDSLEVWVGSQPKYQIPEFIHSHDQQMLFAPTSVTGKPVAGKVEVANLELSDIEGLDIAFARTKDGWSVEMAIPLAYFKEFPGRAGHKACLEMRVNDADKDHKRYKLNPVQGRPSHMDATRWSYLVLAE